MDTKQRIGLVGIGLAGSALSENLLAAGHQVVGFDVDASKVARLVAIGGQGAGSAAEVAAAADRVILSLMSTSIVEQVVEGPDGLLAGEATPRTIIDTTTGEPEGVEALARRLADRGVAYLDATISGSSEQIRRREGVLMVGGERSVFEACADVFDAVAEKTFHVGPVGAGCRAKLAVNLILGLNRAALAEGLVFAERLGLDLPAFLEMARHTAAHSQAMDVKGRRMVEGDFAPAARLSQHRKDVGIILDCAARAGLPLPLSQTHRTILDAAIAAGDGELDNSAVIRQLRRGGRGG